MSKDRRWWSVPRVLPSLNLWRTSDPSEIEGKCVEDVKNESKKDEVEVEEVTPPESNMSATENEIPKPPEQLVQKEEGDSDTMMRLKFRRSPSKRSDRSRSSSLSNCSLKSINRKKDRSSLPPEPNTPAPTEVPDLTGMPDISFSFFNDRDDEFVIVDNSVPSKKEVKVTRNGSSEDSESSYASTSGDPISDKMNSNPTERQNDCDGASLTEDHEETCETDYRIKVFRESPPKTEKGRHVSTLTMTVKVADYCNLDKISYKDHDYEELCEARTEQPYSSPRNSSITITPTELIPQNKMPIYSVVDKSNKKLEKTDSEVETSIQDQELPEVPQPDWDRDSDCNPDYAELTTPEPQKETDLQDRNNEENHEIEELAEESIIKDGPVLKHDYEDLEYCQHRANLRTNLRRMTLMRARRSSVSIKRVRSRIGRAWRAVKGWWIEERIRLGEVILKQAHQQAVQSDEPDNKTSNNEEQPIKRLSSNLDEIQEENLAFSEGGSIILPLKDEINSGDNSYDESEFDQASVSVFSESCPTTPKHVGPVVRRRRHLASPKQTLSRSSSLINFRRSRYCPEGQNGFEELRKYIKQGEDFCKDLTQILQERSEAEIQYSKTLSKLSAKLLKATKEAVGTVNQAWQKVAIEMETQSEAHRSLANALSEEVVKPLRILIESQHRVRKNVETAVDKTGKSLGEWRSAESKSKKQSFASARENEKLQDAMLDIRLANQNNTKLSTSTLHLHSQKVVSDKENAKMETKRRKAEDSVKKADVEYYTYCIRAERARLEWESAVTRGSHCFQTLEEERLQNLKELALCYLHHYKGLGPKLVQSGERLQEPVESCDISQDLDTVVSLKGTGQPVPEQLLPDFYAEHITLAMNKDRRRQALVKILQLIRQDLERERRSKQGVENLARALKQTPNFGTEDSQQNVTEKLHHMRSMLTYLEAARFKVQNALAEIEGQTKGNHPLASHIQITRDRQGLQQSILKVPTWVRKESIEIADSPEWMDRGAADGNSVQPDSDFDEFSSQGSERDYQSTVISQYPVPPSSTITPRCKALYHYAANLYDELNLAPGDVINIHDKQADGWWLGELNGVIGIFPATYVEEIK